MDQVCDRYIKKGIEQGMEIVLEEKLVESGDDLKLCQQNNGNCEDKYKQGRRFEDLEGGELLENTQRLARLSILKNLMIPMIKYSAFQAQLIYLIKIKELNLYYQMTPKIKIAYRKTYQNMKERKIM
ncbi:hypothetical protein O181_047542 [Austropuccinia psidii MF-1]|uniref:Uncharacterized protein n=1 Tax=Austropuccinia psidii MF-1 TaxID=1389203 RepID=A0A9Q3DY13_9BASI|nr:hypothetical protein [Austropuccinia psidii MF-1]